MHSVTVQAEVNNSKEEDLTCAANCRQKLENRTERLDIVATDPGQDCTKSSLDNEIENRYDAVIPLHAANGSETIGKRCLHAGNQLLSTRLKNTPLENENHISSVDIESVKRLAENQDHEISLQTESSGEDWLHTGYQQLPTRLADLPLENQDGNQSLSVVMKSVRGLVAASRELKRENRALLDEYRNFKQHVLNTRCPECLRLIYQNKSSMNLFSVTGETQRIQHVAGMSRVYMACEQGKQKKGLDEYDAKLNSMYEAENGVENRLQSCEKDFANRDRNNGKTSFKFRNETDEDVANSVNKFSKNPALQQNMLLARLESRPQKSDAYETCGTRTNLHWSDEETAEKYKALLANLRSTCDLAKSQMFQTGEGHCEDYLSADELLLLTNSYEHLSNQRKILENKNRILGLEIEKLVSRLVSAEENAYGRTLPSISEENLQERLAEMQDRLDAKEGELSELRKIFIAKKCKREKTLQENEETVRTINNGKMENVEHFECRETPFVGKNDAALPNIDENDCIEFRSCLDHVLILEPKLAEKSGSLPYSEQTVVTENESAKRQFSAYMNGEEHFGAKQPEIEQNPSEMETRLRSEIFRLETKNRRLKDELKNYKKRLEEFQVESDPESMFCVQERLASEVDQLSRRLECAYSELAASNTAYRQIEAAYNNLQTEMKKLTRRVGYDGDERTPGNVHGVDKHVAKIPHFQLVNEYLRPSSHVKTGGVEIRYEEHNEITGGHETTKDFVVLDSEEQERVHHLTANETVSRICERISGDGEWLQSQQSAVKIQPVTDVDAAADADADDDDVTVGSSKSSDGNAVASASAIATYAVTDGAPNRTVTGDPVCIFIHFINFFISKT